MSTIDAGNIHSRKVKYMKKREIPNNMTSCQKKKIVYIKKIYFLYLKTDDPGRLEALLSRNGHSSF